MDLQHEGLLKFGYLTNTYKSVYKLYHMLVY